MTGPDPYDVLGVPRGATPAEINHAYRALLLRLHPDTRTSTEDGSPASDVALQQVIAAYASLTTPPPGGPEPAAPAERGPAAPADVRRPRGAATGATPLLRVGPIRREPSTMPGRPGPEDPRAELISALLRMLRGD